MIFETPNSNNIASFSYPDSGDTETLTVTFKSGRSYEYAEVPRDLFHEMIATNSSGGSVGSVFARKVKDKFETTEV